MNRFKLTLISLTLLALALPGIARADDEPPTCEAIKAWTCPPNAFEILALPDSKAALTLVADKAFLLHHECASFEGALHCMGWPQEHRPRGRLRYQWTFERHGSKSKTMLAEGHAVHESILCAVPEPITVTLTVSNGTYSASSSETYACGAPSY